MKNAAFDNGYGSRWTDIYVTQKDGYYTSVTDFHEHDFYEMNLILSGNFKVILSDRAEEANTCRLVLTQPNTPHFISCRPDTKYSRLYLLFSKEFLMGSDPAWQQLTGVFGERGRILTLDERQQRLCTELIRQINAEQLAFRKKLLLLYLLSCIGEFSGNDTAQPVPSYLIRALNCIEENYGQRITAQKLTQQLFVGRTTLLTAFKRYTGMTVHEYLLRCRLKHALRMLLEGRTQAEAAECCGLGDSGNLIRSFRRYYHMTPKQYLKQLQEKE